VTRRRALGLVFRAYGRRSAGVRAHTAIRILTCPLQRVAAAIPAGTRRLLEIGAGHGVFSLLARDRVPFVVGVEPDLRKAHRVEGVHVVAGFDDAVGGEFDVLALIDVLYTIPHARWDALLTAARARLRPGGTILVKEQDPAARLKNAWNRVQEFVAQKVLRVTMAEAFAYETRETFTARLERLGFTEVRSTRIDRGYPHPHVLYEARRG
jgi:2-polyprenyl-3-methyl-5-hydroxy-6-metoxy-1,4-benzoquinol methylase